MREQTNKERICHFALRPQSWEIFELISDDDDDACLLAHLV